MVSLRGRLQQLAKLNLSRQRKTGILSLSTFKSNTISISIKMSANVTSTNPVVQAIVAGTAPQAARMAAARGLLPLAQADLMEALVALRASNDAEIAGAAQATLDEQPPTDLLAVAKANDAAPSVLAFLATHSKAERDVYEAVTLNAQ